MPCGTALAVCGPMLGFKRMLTLLSKYMIYYIQSRLAINQYSVGCSSALTRIRRECPIGKLVLLRRPPVIDVDRRVLEPLSPLAIHPQLLPVCWYCKPWRRACLSTVNTSTMCHPPMPKTYLLRQFNNYQQLDAQISAEYTYGKSKSFQALAE